MSNTESLITGLCVLVSVVIVLVVAVYVLLTSRYPGVVTSYVSEIITRDEKVIFIAIQGSFLDINRDSVILTDKRFMFYRPKSVWGAVDFSAYHWLDMPSISLKEDNEFATITMNVQGKRESISSLPKQKARRLHKLADEMKEKWLKIKRKEDIELARAAAPQISVYSGSSGSKQSYSGAQIYGTVKFYDSYKEFGFIEPDQGGQDVHVGRKNLVGINLLNRGDRVEFTLKQGRKGPWAVNVKKL